MVVLLRTAGCIMIANATTSIVLTMTSFWAGPLLDLPVWVSTIPSPYIRVIVLLLLKPLPAPVAASSIGVPLLVFLKAPNSSLSLVVRTTIPCVVVATLLPLLGNTIPMSIMALAVPPMPVLGVGVTAPLTIPIPSVVFVVAVIQTPLATLSLLPTTDLGR